jgi:hypothetical protein
MYSLEKTRKGLCKVYLCLEKSDDDTGIFEAVDSFVELSQGNTIVQHVDIYPYEEDPGNYELWDKVGQGVGNLKSLEMLYINLNNEEGVNNEGDEPNRLLTGRYWLASCDM